MEFLKNVFFFLLKAILVVGCSCTLSYAILGFDFDEVRSSLLTLVFVFIYSGLIGLIAGILGYLIMLLMSYLPLYKFKQVSVIVAAILGILSTLPMLSVSVNGISIKFLIFFLGPYLFSIWCFKHYSIEHIYKISSDSNYK